MAVLMQALGSDLVGVNHAIVTCCILARSPTLEVGCDKENSVNG